MATAALACFSSFRPRFGGCSSCQAATCVTPRQLSTVSGGGAKASLPVATEGISAAPLSSSARTALEVAVPPLSAYRHLLMKRLKHPLLYDPEAKGFLG